MIGCCVLKRLSAARGCTRQYSLWRVQMILPCHVIESSGCVVLAVMFKRCLARASHGLVPKIQTRRLGSSPKGRRARRNPFHGCTVDMSESLDCNMGHVRVILEPRQFFPQGKVEESNGNKAVDISDAKTYSTRAQPALAARKLSSTHPSCDTPFLSS